MFQKKWRNVFVKRRGQSVWNFISFSTGFYDAEYLFTVDENVFIPPPKVKSGVYV
jgi:16S rRNA (adenine1518-N6/adenine1519-N6)-dimethyltransferase